MAGSLLALIDDIASLLDDVALMTKVAAKKTVGMLSDDLAVNAEQVSGVRADRELPVVWAVAKGSLLNKAILVPGALGISLVAPWLITPLLMVGGAYLCYEGAEKVVHHLLHSSAGKAAQPKRRAAMSSADLRALERQKIKGAIRTDFILSAEIVVITLGTVADAGFGMQVAVLVGIAVLLTAGVYGVVAAIVKIDDLGLWLAQRGQGERVSARLQYALGRLLLGLAPRLMKALSVLGTLAMFLVGGGIISHGVPRLGRLFDGVASGIDTLPGVGSILAGAIPSLLHGLLGLLVGLLLVAAGWLLHRLRR